MTDHTRDLREALKLLVMLFRAQQQMVPKLDEAERHTIRVTPKHLDLAQLTLPTFSNTLTKLDSKGYLFSVTIFDDKLREQLLEFYNGPQFEKILNHLEQMDTSAVDVEGKRAALELAKRMLPPNSQIDEEGLLNSKLTLVDMIQNSRNEVLKLPIDVAALVLLSPERSIERLLDKLDEGTSLKDVQDSDVWIDAKQAVLHIAGKQISLSIGNKRIIAYDVFDTLLTHHELGGSTQIEYQELDEYRLGVDPDKENGRFYNSVHSLIQKHPILGEYFHATKKELALTKEI